MRTVKIPNTTRPFFRSLNGEDGIGGGSEVIRIRVGDKRSHPVINEGIAFRRAQKLVAQPFLTRYPKA